MSKLINYRELFERVLKGELKLVAQHNDYDYLASWKADGQDFYVYAERKNKRKSVDLSVLIDSGIDCEFGEANCYIKAGLENIITYGDGKVAYQARDLGNRYSKCRPRMNHIHAWQGGECPLPEGFIVDVWYRDIDDETDSDTGRGLATQMQWAHEHYGNDIIAFEVIGLADGYCYPWECDE